MIRDRPGQQPEVGFLKLAACLLAISDLNNGLGEEKMFFSPRLLDITSFIVSTSTNFNISNPLTSCLNIDHSSDVSKRRVSWLQLF